MSSQQFARPAPPVITQAVADLRYLGVPVTANGTTDNRAAIVAADTAAQAFGGTVSFLPGLHSVATFLLIASPVSIEAGAVIKPANGAGVKFGGHVTAPLKQVFDHSAGGKCAPLANPDYHPAWWGPLGTADDTTTWQACADASDYSVAASDPVNALRFQQRIQAIALLPLHVQILATHMPVRRYLAVLRTEEIEILDDRSRT